MYSHRSVSSRAAPICGMGLLASHAGVRSGVVPNKCRHGRRHGKPEARSTGFLVAALLPHDGRQWALSVP